LIHGFKLAQEMNMQLSYHFILGLSWMLYAFLHSFLADSRVKAKIAVGMGTGYKYYRLLYSIFAAVSIVIILGYQFSNASPDVFTPFVVSDIAGGAITVIGLTGMAICIKKYFMNLSGVDVLLKKEHQSVLEVKGLHRAVRHPLYTSTLMFCWGLFLILPYYDNLISCVIITAYTLFGIKLEEKKLHEEFGQQYRVYAETTPMIIPRFGALFASRP
jgi:protein-S-isoprenylcysteine O-methyltransferase Ste14